MAATVSLPQAPAAAPQSAASLPNLEALPVSIQNLPDNLVDIARPVQLNGVLIDMVSDGALTLRTASGTVNIALQALQADVLQNINDTLGGLLGTTKTVTLVIQPGTPPTQATILIPKSETATKASLAPSPLTTSPLLTEGSKAPPLLKGQELSLTQLPKGVDAALLVHERGTETSIFSHLQKLLSERITTRTTGVVQRNMSALIESWTDPEKGAGIALTSTKEGQVTTSAHHRVARPILDASPRVRIDSVLPPAIKWPEGIDSTQVRATVLGRAPSGHTLVHAEGKSFFIKQEGQLPQGTRLVLAPLPENMTKAETQASSAERFLPAMREMVSLLLQLEPDTASTFLQNKLPTPAHALSGTALFLLAALHTGKLEEWMGPPVVAQLARIGKKNVADSVIREMADATTMTQDTRVGEWKVFPFPMHHGNIFDRLTLYVRSDRDAQQKEDERRASTKRTRFVITMNMTRLGAMQIDGLSQPKKLDLVVRSENELPESLPQELRLTYTQTMEALGLTGTIGFQSGRQNWIMFENERPQGTDRSL